MSISKIVSDGYNHKHIIKQKIPHRADKDIENNILKTNKISIEPILRPKRPYKQPTSQPTNQSINQSINHTSGQLY
jgi:hypothetical protein